MLVCPTSWPVEDHNARAGSGNVAYLVAGGVRQHPAAAVALGAADDRLPAEFPDPAAAQDVLHTGRVDLTLDVLEDPVDRRFFSSLFHLVIAPLASSWYWEASGMKMKFGSLVSRETSVAWSNSNPARRTRGSFVGNHEVLRRTVDEV